MIRAIVNGAPWNPDAVAVAIMNSDGDNGPHQILHLGSSVASMARSWDNVEPCAEVQPTLMLQDAEARALLDALTRHYHGAEDTRALRRDYDAERKRVDDLTGHLAVIARALSTPSPSAAPPEAITVNVAGGTDGVAQQVAAEVQRHLRTGRQHGALACHET